MERSLQGIVAYNKNTKNGVAVTYYYQDGDYIYIDNNFRRHVFKPLFDSEGNRVNGVVYRYIKNLQGDIVAIYQGDTKVAEYAYDAWGNCTIKQDTDGIGTFNAIRYRGYYYDVETGLYYLMTRYYDPTRGRFISPDNVSYLDPATIQGLNLFAYCGNNPVMYVDPNGTSITAILITLIIGAIIGAIVGGVVGNENGHTGLELVGDIFLGAAIGLAAAGLAVAGGTAIYAGISSALGYTAATVFGGVSIKTAVAIGLLAYDGVAVIVAPILGIKMQVIELGKNAPNVPQQPSYNITRSAYSTTSNSVNTNPQKPYNNFFASAGSYYL